jgi:peptidoglycan/LPS O-acetylase OafA/YrhL
VREFRSDLPFLDGLRGLSALGVAVFHAYLFTGNWGQARRDIPEIGLVTSWGQYGVPVFLVLSGFVLTLPVVRRADLTLPRGTLTFLLRRAKRILPPYYAAFGLSLLLIFLYPTMQSDTGTKWDDKIPITPGGVVSHLLMIHNLKSRWALQGNGPLWTVATEWQLYFVLPLVLLPLWRRLNPWIVTVLTLALAVWLTFEVPAIRSTHPWLMASFALGMIAAFGYARYEWRPALLGWLTVVTALTVFAGFVVRPGGGQLALFGHGYLWRHAWCGETALALAAACLVLWLARSGEVNGNGRLRRTLESRPLAGLGLMSYSLYLIHSPLLAASNLALRPLQLGTMANWAVLTFVAVPATVASAWIFFRLVERHFLNSHQSRASVTAALSPDLSLAAPTSRS